MVHGTEIQRVRYENATVPYGSECVSEIQTSTCNNGTWEDWTGTFTNLTCSVDSPADCDDVPHGGQTQRIRFEQASVPSDQTCTYETQTGTCNNGTWEDWTGTFTHETCSVEGFSNCGIWPHNTVQQRTRWQTATVPYGESCVSEEQTSVCEDGTWSDWTGTYSEEACVVQDPADCNGTPHGGTQERTRWQAASVPYGESCVSEVQTSVCDNGTWGDWSGTYTEESCEVEEPADCDGTPHGGQQQRTRWQAAVVPYDESCVSEVQTRQCNNGVWTDWTGTYTHESCEVEEYAGSCNFSAYDNCQEYTGSIYTPEAVQTIQCPSGSGGQYLSGPCPSAGRVGSCIVLQGMSNEYIFVYYSPTYNASSAQTNCIAGGGVWVP